jgi:signal transduction histidine kinase
VTGPGRLGLGVRAQILLALALVTLFAVFSTGYLALWAGGGSLLVHRESAASAIASSTALAAAAAVEPGTALEDAVNDGRLGAVLSRVGGQADVAGVQILGAARSVVVARPPRLPQDSDPPSAVGVFSGAGPLLHYRPSPIDGSIELLAYAPILLGPQTIGVVRVSTPAPPPVLEMADHSGLPLLGLALGNAALVIALGFFVLTHLVVRPLQVVERATARVTAGDWEQRIEPEGPREVAGLAASFNQMTASLAAQREQLIRTEKLASVGQLAAGVAHEIGNPLAAVLGFVDILRMDAADADRPALSAAERRDALDRVKSETQRIHRIIQDLLAYSRPAKEEAQATDPLAVLRAAEALLAPQSRFRGVKVVADETAAGAWPLVLVSGGRLAQVFVNLLLNAADAMGGQGQVRVTAAARGSEVVLTFEDDGPGIGDEVARKIFDPFFTTKPPGYGTGLGLSISRAIVESYGGTLELAPARDGAGGARFSLALPAVAATVER